jgi:hypothetical protein
LVGADQSKGGLTAKGNPGERDLVLMWGNAILALIEAVTWNKPLSQDPRVPTFRAIFKNFSATATLAFSFASPTPMARIRRRSEISRKLSQKPRATNSNRHRWKLGETLEAELVVTALENALTMRTPDRGLYFHSDRGSQYSSQAVRKPLSVIAANLSMSGLGNCYDNAKAEAFFSTLKSSEPISMNAH